LPIQIATAIYRKTNIRTREASTFDDFPNILKVAKAVINKKYEVSRLRDEDSRDDIDKLVHTMAKDQPKFDPSQVARESSRATRPDMNQLANEFQKMVLSLMSKSNANLTLKPTIRADFDDPSAGIYVTISPELSGKCWYYSESDHFQRECPSFRHLINLGLCYKAANNKVYFSKAGAYPNPAIIRYKWCSKLPRLRYMLPLLEDKHGRKIEFGEVPS
jgi:hypothetical protein